MAVSGHIERLVAAVEEFDNIRWRRSVNDGGSDELVHSLVVGGLGGIVNETGTANINGTREKSHAEGFLVGDALQSPNKIRALKILERRM